MKKSPFIPVLFVLALLLGTVGCKKILDLLTFQINDSSTFQLPATGPLPIGTAGPVIALPGVTVNSTANSTYQNNNTAADYVKDVTLDRLALTVTDPAGQNFDFVKSISISIASDAAGTNKVPLASLNPVPTGQTTIELTPSGQKLDTYLRSGSYTLFTTVEMTQLGLSKATTVRADSRFNVKADPK
ncbi:hypothetical protein KB206_01360 [Microvirga sp. STS02]|uniref:hypothetical protein n=1 Tax=Hymenobacter negativus TaxID=2795026 RepID=UPI0018DB1425|nr:MULTISPECIES: hypothetical protein [Bacteria]MBH8567515.1 hypothetical protein [Hymenobacter negativus]MBR7207247.1 hypothetical protein [Microvirga sp. STS02]